MNLQILAAVCALSLFVGFGSGWKTHAWKTDAAFSRQLAQQKKEYEKKLTASEALLAEVSAQKQKTRVIYREVRNEARKTDLGTCALSDDALKLLSDAARGPTAPASGKPDAAQPAGPGPR